LGEVFVAPYDVVFATSTVLEPDVLFVSSSRLHYIGEDNLSGPPDLAIEVISESPNRLDREVKMKQYALHGVGEYWLVAPEGNTVDVLRLKEGEYELAERLGFGDTLSSPLFPRLKLPVASLWES
jgi:Uma2 family endonuclease